MADQNQGGDEVTSLAKSNMVRLAYQLILGREPENEEVVVKQSRFTDIYELRNRLMLSGEHNVQERCLRLAELLYMDEADIKSDTEKFNALLSADSKIEARIREIILRDAGLIKYTTFHSRRFFDQIRAVVAVRQKMLATVERPRVLEIGVSPVTSMYRQLLDDIDLYTANLPSGAPPANIARRVGSIEHFYVDLDSNDLSERHPHLIAEPFHIVLLCEVIEHLRASPDEVFRDLMKIVAPGGILIVSTPNAMSARCVLQLAIGRKADFIYRREDRDVHEQHHAHVREYTRNEIRSSLLACGATILMHAVKNYYSDLTRSLLATNYLSARDAQIALATRD